MRKRTLILIFLIVFAQVLFAQDKGVHVIASLDFNAGSAGDCSARVSAEEAALNGPPMQVLIISCQGKINLSYPTQDALIDLFLNYPHDDPCLRSMGRR
jgi:hypothetical protein